LSQSAHHIQQVEIGQVSISWVVRTAIAQRDAVAAITKVRGQAFYELNPTDEVLAWKKRSAFGRSDGECIVIDFVFQVMSVDIEVTPERFDAVRQQALARVGDLVRLKSAGGPVTWCVGVWNAAEN
jgi:hypothetical protein